MTPKKLYSQEEVAIQIHKFVYVTPYDEEGRPLGPTRAAEYFNCSRTFLYAVIGCKDGHYPNDEMLKAIGYEKMPDKWFKKNGEDNNIPE